MIDLRERFAELNLIEAPAAFESEGIPTPTRKSPIQSPRRRLWQIVAGAAAATLLLIGGVAWLARILTQEGPEAPAATQPPASTTTPPETTTTPPETTTVDPAFLPVFSDEGLPAFSGTLRLAGSRLRIQYAGPGLGLRVDLIESWAAGYEGPFAELVEGGPGSFLVFDGVEQMIYLSHDHIAELSPPIAEPTGVAQLDWRADGSARWICDSADHTHLGIEEAAGRPAHAINCEGLGQALTVWVDRDTGLILQIDNRNESPLVDDFTFETIRFDPVLDLEAFDLNPPEGATIIGPDPPGPTGEGPLQCGDPWPGAPWGLDECPELFRQMLAANSGDIMNSLGVETGSPAPPPPLTGSHLDGTPFDLRDLHGTPVLLHFWWGEIRGLAELTRDPESPWNLLANDLAAEVWAAEEFNDRLEVRSVAVGEIDIIEGIVALLEHPIPVVSPDGQTIDPECDCPEVWDFAFQPGSNWVLLDAQGNVVAGFWNFMPTEDAITATVEHLE